MRKLGWLLPALAMVLVPIVSSPAEAGKRVRVGTKRPIIIVSKPKPAKRIANAIGKPTAIIDFNVTPKKTKVFVDGVYRGTAGKLDGFPSKLKLAPGKHRIRLVTPDGTTVARTIHAPAGTEVDIDLELASSPS